MTYVPQNGFHDMSSSADSAVASTAIVQDSIAAIAPQRDWLSAIELTALGAIWGGSFLFMRIAAGDFGPVPLVETRLVFGVLILLPFLWQARNLLRTSHWLLFAGVGALNSAIPFVLFAWGAERAPAGIGAISNSMTVLSSTVLVGFVAFGERIGTGRTIALIGGFIGVVVLASGRIAGANVGMAAAAGTLASLCYGVAVNVVKRYLADLPPSAVAAGTLTCSTVFVAPLAWWTWPATPIPALSWGCADHPRRASARGLPTR